MSVQSKISAILKENPDARYSEIARDLGVSRQRVQQVASQINMPSRHANPRKEHAAEYQCWSAMIQRCTNAKSKGWDRYGGRGIRVCDRWRRSFKLFMSDMGARPSAKHSLDRIDSNGHYEPLNCRWATATQQARNKAGVYRHIENLLLLEFTLDEIENDLRIHIPDFIQDKYGKMAPEEYIPMISEARKMDCEGRTVARRLYGPSGRKPSRKPQQKRKS